MIDIYKLPPKKVTVLCHTSCTLGEQSFIKGNEYTLHTEDHGYVDNKNECILCWIESTNIFGARFAVKGNVYIQHGDYYTESNIYNHFTDYFVCPIKRERDNKLTEIGI